MRARPSRVPRPLRTSAGTLVAVSLVAAGCGASDSGSGSSAQTSQPAAKHLKPVDITVRSQGDIVHGSKVILRGTAPRGATLEVDASPVTVNQAGKWRKTVSLSLGSNTFQLRASMAGAKPVEQFVGLTRKRSAAELAAYREHQQILRAQRAAARAAAKARRAAARAQAEANFKAGAVTPPYNQLKKNADAFSGKHVKFTGQIFQIQEDSYGGGMMLLSITHDSYLDMWDDNVWVNYDGNVKGAEDDVVTVAGTITGSKEYDTQIGGSTYVPEMHARYIDE